jgi:hypothetical protein
MSLKFPKKEMLNIKGDDLYTSYTCMYYLAICTPHNHKINNIILHEKYSVRKKKTK